MELSELEREISLAMPEPMDEDDEVEAKEDFYDEDTIQRNLEDDEITGMEEGFMVGYMSS